MQNIFLDNFLTHPFVKQIPNSPSLTAKFTIYIQKSFVFLFCKKAVCQYTNTSFRV